MSREREQPIIIIRKKGRPHGGHHGGAWKVAFADFMTAMMAMFLVMWLVTQSSDVRSAIAGYFQDPLGHASEFGSSIMPGEGAQAANVRPISRPQVMDLRRDRLMQLGERIRRRLEEAVDFQTLKEHVEITVEEEGLRISLLEDSKGMFFESGSATPKPHVVDLLLLIGSELSLLPNPIVVEGHTDARPFAGRRSYSNWELSTDRANAARRVLGDGGVRPEQFVQVRGHADRDLRVKEDPFAASNRRVTILMQFEQGAVEASDSLPAASDSLPTPAEAIP